MDGSGPQLSHCFFLLQPRQTVYTASHGKCTLLRFTQFYTIDSEV